MQDCLMLQNELQELAQMNVCDSLQVIFSEEDWNPVAAVILCNFSLPSNYEIAAIDLRVPIPDLYGFATSATVALLNSAPKRLSEIGEPLSLPCCRIIDEAAISKHKNSFVDVREKMEWKPNMHVLFLTPSWNPEGFHHYSLLSFVHRIRQFFTDPEELTKIDISYSKDRFTLTRNPWWLMHLSYLYQELGDIQSAHAILTEGQTMFPMRRGFSSLLENLKNNLQESA